MENLKNPKTRNRIKRNLRAELKDKNLPFARRQEVQALLYNIKLWEAGYREAQKDTATTLKVDL